MMISKAQLQAVVQAYGATRRNGRGGAANGHGKAVRVVPPEETVLVDTLRRRVGAMPTVRGETVYRLRHLLMRSEYRVSSEDIADLLLRRLIADNIE